MVFYSVAFHTKFFSSQHISVNFFSDCLVDNYLKIRSMITKFLIQLNSEFLQVSSHFVL